ncbi:MULTISPECIES: MJ0042-type zinc finger domain-containing protein [unclassified Methylophaga]|jgi:predicted Zn finger-like uncharacterized protein|nr:hypothetical protein [Methylophaga sp.]MAM27410.1 hypothetical protein [Flavobacteriaceae bacterium]MBP24293.1 hypothetical protein [Methylophaga sp.]HCC80716.1 hypothetical protein [Methylophaga sp.]
MVKTWKSEETSEQCENCRAFYKVVEHRVPVRDKDSFSCTECGHLIKSWNSTSYYIYTLIKD